MFLDTCLSILDVAQKATDVAGKATKLCDWFTGVSAGEHMNSVVNQLAGNNSRVERLSDRVWYAPNLQQAINQEGNKQLQNNQQIFDLINPVAEALGTDVLASAVISTPDKLKQAFKKDPWELLIEVRPATVLKNPLILISYPLPSWMKACHTSAGKHAVRYPVFSIVILNITEIYMFHPISCLFPISKR